MGLTKQYLRYVPEGKFNIITSAGCNTCFVTLNNHHGRYVATGASEDVIIWDLRLSEKLMVIEGEKSIVHRLAINEKNNQIAAGFSDGMTKTFDLQTGDNIHIFSGHRSPISAMTYDLEGHYLVTGSKDTDIVIWDIIAESGLHRLSGHKGVITDVKFINHQNVVISSSTDTFIKFWDLSNGLCFKTITDHITEVWGLILLKDDTYMVAASCDNELRVYQLKENSKILDGNLVLQNFTDEETMNNFSSPIICTKIGSILRETKGHVVHLSVDPSSQTFCCYGNDKILELFYVVPEEDARKKYLKKQKRLKDRLEKSEIQDDPGLNQLIEDLNKNSPNSLKYMISRLPAVKLQTKIKSCSIVLKKNQISVCVSLANNSIELYTLDNYLKGKEINFNTKISQLGHQSDIKLVTFSSDNLMVASGSQNDLKIWNKKTLSCMRTMEVSNILSGCFMPGDQFVLIGTKDGNLVIGNAKNSDIVETITAHDAEISSICILPNKMGCVTGSGDKTVKIWQIVNPKGIFNNSDSKKIISLTNSKTLNVEESVLIVKVSPDSNLLAASVLDCTVKIYFMDTFKFFLSLYGHKLPITCMDISYDSRLIATGSADRNIKIWGLDYGDCHKSIFAHEDSVSALNFIPNTHYFFTGGKDGRIKQWDADNFERIVSLHGHNGEISNLSVSSNGQDLVSCGQDRVIRLFRKSDEIVVLEDEREVEREEEDEKTLVTGAESAVLGHTKLNLASKKTVTTEKGAELLLECLEVIKNYNDELNESKIGNQAPPSIPLIMTAFNAKTTERYFVTVLQKIRSSELEETLLLLPFSSVCDMFNVVLTILKNNSPFVELLVRVLGFLIRLNHKPIISSSPLYPVIKSLRKKSIIRISQLKDEIGFNYYSLLHLQRRKEHMDGVEMFEDALFSLDKKKAVKRKKEMIRKTALLKL